MPRSNGKIYTETRNGVKYGVSCHDVAATIGAASLDVGTLCTHPNIAVGAMYKPFICDTPAPPTMAQRRGAQYGIYIPTGYMASPAFASDPARTQWTHVAPTGNEWKRPGDFAADSDGKGYYRDAPLPAEATVTFEAKGRARATFSFDGNENNGGIKPEELDINAFEAGERTMSGLYPGILVFIADGGTWAARYVGTTNDTVGKGNKSAALSASLKLAGIGYFRAFAILSPKKHLTEHGTSPDHKVAYISNAMAEGTVYDFNTGMPLYGKYAEYGEFYTDSLGSTDLINKKFQYPYVIVGDGLSISPTKELTVLADKDKRFMVNIKLEHSANYNPNFKCHDWCPIKDGDINSPESFDDVLKRVVAYPLCYWNNNQGLVALLLVYEPDKNQEWYFVTDGFGRTEWKMSYRRYLAFADENDVMLSTIGIGNMTVNGEDSSMGSWYVKDVVGESLTYIRFGNTVEDSNMEVYSTGIYVELNGGIDKGGSVATHTNGVYVIDASDNENGKLHFFSRHPTDGVDGIDSLLRIPSGASTKAYIDITLDTAGSQEGSYPDLFE